MRGRFSVGVVLVSAVLLAISSVGLSGPPSARFEQFATPTFTPVLPSSPTPTLPLVTDTPTPIATTPGAPTETPGTTPGTTPGPGGQPTARPPRGQGAPATPGLGIKVNACARVVGPDGLSLGAAPGFAAAHVQIVGRNDVVFVLEGPTRADGLWWWKVATRNNVQGWGNNDHMLPSTGDCFGLNAAGTPIPTIVSSGANGAGAVTPTLAAQSQLPDTGASSAPIIFAGALALIILFVGLIRRRTQGTI